MISTIGQLAVKLAQWQDRNHGIAPPFWPLNSRSFDMVAQDAKAMMGQPSVDWDFKVQYSMLVRGTVVLRFDGPLPPDVLDPSE